MRNDLQRMIPYDSERWYSFTTYIEFKGAEKSGKSI